MTKTINDRSRGFTLTELAVVMVIVAIMLGGLMVPLSTLLVKGVAGSGTSWSLCAVVVRAASAGSMRTVILVPSAMSRSTEIARIDCEL